MEIIEVGPRDGLQNESKILSTAIKVEYIHALLDAGLRRIEAVSFAKADRVPQMKDAEAVMSAVPRDRGASYIGLVLNDFGARRAVDAGVDEANIVIVATDTFSLRNQGMSTADSLRALDHIVPLLKNAGLRVSVTIGAAFGCPFEGEVPADRVTGIVEQLGHHDLDEIALADTIGVAVPTDVRRLVTASRLLTTLPLRLHLHNTRNTGYANAAEALELGVEGLDASSGGIGGCPFAPAATGNIATEDLYYLAERSGIPTGLSFPGLLTASRFVTSALGIHPEAMLGRSGMFPGGA
ncbi:hydroxymethylglutaryl-CoA lyase [Subtercola boreus]|uniref:Hydroxymethylglutaryl-CoA lyase n=1 Tax=Subtercola boreus TaxID=120213 RepID=A0A3E0VXI4_9MICO|nr:hydroxymethylglutaryl-CoA lyase [Subtercola boreus]RFA14596.1 hydroxymethylglutaryl-CoA lyase [Subtercola boreus]